MKKFITKQLTVILGMASVLVVANGAGSYLNTRQLIENEQLVTHTHQVLAELKGTFSTLKEAEAGQHGYLLTQDPAYLEPYYAALARNSRHIQRLQQLIADNPAQQKRLGVIEQKISQRLSIFKKTLALHGAKGTVAAKEVIQLGNDKIVIDEIHQIIAQMETTEQNLLIQRSGQSRASFQKTIATLSLATLLNLIFLGLLYYFINRDITKRQQAAARLRESEEQFRLLAENSTDMISRHTAEGVYLYVSPASKGILGYAPEELIGHNAYEFFHADDLAKIKQSHDTILEVGGNNTITYRIRCQDGNYIWLETISRSIQNAQTGEVIEIHSASRDVTARQQVEEALRESNTRLRAIVDAEPECVKIVAANGTLLEMNAAGLAMIEADSADVVLGKSVYGLIAKEYKQQFKTLNENVCNLGEKGTLEFELVSCKGRSVWLETHAVPLCNPLTKECVQLAITRDITSRKRSEQQIREQAALLDVATDAIVVRSMDNKIIFWNKSAERLYGWLAADAIDQNIDGLLYGNNLSQTQEALKMVVATGEWQGKLNQVNIDGKEIIVESRWTLVKDEQQQPKSILSVNTDITEKVKLEAQFLRAQRMESIGTLAGGIAHDLNNVLAPVLMAVQLLQLKFPQEHQLLGTLETNIKRGAALIKQVLSFAKGIEGQRTSVQLKHLILEVTHIAKQTFPKSIEVVSDLPSELWAVSGDGTQLHQVLMNLVVNARDAMPDGGLLRLKAQNVRIDSYYARMNLEAQVGNYILLTVADSGTGIESEVLERIFEPFFTTKELGKGTGLGLSTVIGIVKSHGGFVNVYSELGKGTEFKVYLPAVDIAETSLLAEVEILVGSGDLILVVDDEVAIREITKTSLETYNYQVLTASDGVEALSLYIQYQEQISVVLLDIMMPVMDGIDTISTLQQLNPQVKIIAISGLMSNEKIAEATGNGVQAFLPKPCTAKELLSAIDAAIKTDYVDCL